MTFNLLLPWFIVSAISARLIVLWIFHPICGMDFRDLEKEHEASFQSQQAILSTLSKKIAPSTKQ